MINFIKEEEKQFNNNYIKLNQLSVKYNIRTEEQVKDIVELVNLLKYFSKRGVRFDLK